MKLRAALANAGLVESENPKGILFGARLLALLIAALVVFLGTQPTHAQDPVSEITDADDNSLVIVYEDGKLEVTGGFVLPDGTLLDESSDIDGGSDLSLPFSSSASSSDPLFALIQTGAGRAGVFSVDNGNSFTEALLASNNGSGNAIKGLQTGTGRAGLFQVLNETSSADALRATTNGTGRAGSFAVTKVDNSAPALFAETVGGGRAARFRIANAGSGAEALRTSTNGVSHAGVFEIDNSFNDSSAVQGVTNGTGPAVQGIQRSAGGHAGDFKIFSSTSTEAALWAETSGTGPAVVGHQGGSAPDSSAHAGFFEIVNANSDAEALLIHTNGQGEAVEAVQTGTGPGAVAGSFLNTDSNNDEAALRAKTFGSGFAAKLVANKSATVIDNPHGNAALIRNTSGENGPDVLGLQAGPSNPGVGVNYLTFYDRTGTSVGAIEGNGSGGIALKTSGADYAEALPVREKATKPEPADLVGVRGGTVGLATKEADRLMVVTGQPAVLGNADLSAGKGSGPRVPVAFIGQVPVKLRGPAQAGDLIVASGREDGTARAVKPSLYRPTRHGPVAGQVWSPKSADGLGTVTAAVGLGQSALVARRIGSQQRQIDALRDRVRALEHLEKRQNQMAKQVARLTHGSFARRAGGIGSVLWILAFGLGGFGAGLFWRRWG